MNTSNGTSSLENSLTLSLKFKHKFTIQPSSSTPRFLQNQRKWKRVQHKDSHRNVHSSIMHNSPKQKQSKCPTTDEWINCDLFKLWYTTWQQKGTNGTHNNMDESWKNYASKKKTDTKVYFMISFILNFRNHT